MKLMIFMAVLTLNTAFAFTNNPSVLDFDGRFNYKLSQLPKSGTLEGTGLAWPSYYWATNKGSVSQRWQSGRGRDYQSSYKSPSKSRVLSMSKEALNRLSPAEKYDIYLGRYDYPTVRMSRPSGRSMRRAKEWNGICHGMAPASLNHREPVETTVVSADGVELKFYASDLKGLIGFRYAYSHGSVSSPQVGTKCRRRPIRRRGRLARACADVDPAAFHVIMANLLGIQKKSFIADIDRYTEVWNHAARKYTSTYLASGSQRRVRVRTQIDFAGGIDPTLSAVLGTQQAKWEHRTYEYWLNLDSRGRIIGGDWISDGGVQSRPDFLWRRNRAKYRGTHFEKLFSEIYHAAY